MKVLTIGSDRNLFVKDSEPQKRIREYGKLFEELHIVVFTKRRTTNDERRTTIGNNVLVYPTNSKSKFFYLLDAYQIAKSLVVSRKLSVISCQDPFESGFVGWLLKMRYKLPLQLQIHTDIFSSYFRQESFKNKIRVLLAKFLLPRADGIRVVSERIKNSLVAFHSSLSTKIVALPIFVDIKKIQSAKAKIDLRQKYPEHDFIILMASRLTKEKNIGMAIEAMRSILQDADMRIKCGYADCEYKNLSASSAYDSQHPHYNPLLLIVGDGPEREALQKLIIKYEVGNSPRSPQKSAKSAIVMEPWTNDLISYYKTADLFLLTSNYEGYGRTVVEAMAAGLPVIMTDVGLAGEFLIDDLDGRVVSIGDAKALAAAILELKENAIKREEFKQNSLKLLEKWPTKQEYLKKYKDSLLGILKII